MSTTAGPATRSRADGARVDAARPGREPFWDNVRFVAITLVVVGHSIEKLSDSDLMAALYVAIYAVHMPLFAFVCGRFASAEPRPGSGAKLVSQLVVPYVLFSAVWAALLWLVDGESRFDLARPYWHLWFLVALGVWRLVLPALASLRYPVTVSLVVAVAAGYLHGVGTSFDSGRILGMLPFFVLGWALRERGIPDAWRSVRARTAAVVVLVGAPVVAFLAIDVVRALRLRQWAQMEDNYVDLGVTEWWAGLLRLGMFGVAVVLGCALLVLVPRGRNRTTRWGAATMYVYLLHLFPLYLLRELTDLQDRFDSAPMFALLVVLAVGWSIALSSAQVRRIFRPVVEPRVAWLFARRGPAREVVGT